MCNPVQQVIQDLLRTVGTEPEKRPTTQEIATRLGLLLEEASV